MKHRGFTMAELTITITLMFLLGLCIFEVILPSFRIAAEGQIRTELQQQGELAFQQMATDLQGSVPTGVTLVAPTASQGAIMATHPLSAIMGTSGLLTFDARLNVWWHDLAKKQLFRRTFQNGDPPAGLTLPFDSTQALQPSAANLISIVGASSPRSKSYALSVETLLLQKEVTTAAGNDYAEVYALRIVLSKVIPGKKASAVVELFRKVMLRNHY